MLTRRAFLQATTVAAAGSIWAPSLLAADARLCIGSCSLNLEQARQAGLDGVEVRAGNPADRLEIADPAKRSEYKQKMKETGLKIQSIMMGLFNQCPLASDPRGPAWLEQTIEGAKDLGAKVILVAFFGKGDLSNGKDWKQAEVDVVVDRIKAAAPLAEKAGVILGIENTLSAEQNLRILDRVKSPAVQVYYDVYNLSGKGYDPAAEIRQLKGRIAQIHFKNGPDYLETGKVKFEAPVAAIKETGYKGWIVLETSSPSKNGVADAARNAAYIKKLFGWA